MYLRVVDEASWSFYLAHLYTSKVYHFRRHFEHIRSADLFPKIPVFAKEISIVVSFSYSYNCRTVNKTITFL